MATANPYRQYQTTQVQTAGPAQLTLMCYDGALRFLSQAREAMLGKRYDVQSAMIGKTQALLDELLKGLDFERGGEVARNLQTMYKYWYQRLTHANMRDDVAALDEVRAHIADIRGAWQEAMHKAGSTGPMETAPRRDFALAI